MVKNKVKFLMIVTIILGFIAFSVIGFLLESNPLKPEITYGEFPFHLKYEINGVDAEIQDILICEYDGTSINEG